MVPTTAADCLQALLLNWVARYGMPWHLTSDHSLHFISVLWVSMASSLGVSLHNTSSYHLQSNGVVELFHWSPKALLKCYLNNPSWMEQLLWVLLSLLSSVRCKFGCSSTDLVFHHSPVFPVSWSTILCHCIHPPPRLLISSLHDVSPHSLVTSLLWTLCMSMWKLSATCSSLLMAGMPHAAVS